MISAQVIPNTHRAGSLTSLAVEVQSDEPLSLGAKVEWQFPDAWTAYHCQSFTKEFQADDPHDLNYVAVKTPNADCSFQIDTRLADFDTGTSTGRHGRRITATLESGHVPPGQTITLQWRNTPAAWVAEREQVFVAINGATPAELPEIVTTPLEAERLRVIVPSSAQPGQPFTARIISLDRFSNVSSTHYEGLPIYDDGGKALTLPFEFTGSYTAELQLGGEGIHRLRWGDVWSNPIKIAQDARGPYWGDTHIHTRFSGDGMGRFPYEYAREVSGLDFCATADHHDNVADRWERIRRWAAEHHEPGRFVTLLAYEGTFGAPSGHHNTYFVDLEGEMFDIAAIDGDARKLWDTLDAERAMSIPHHTGMIWGKSELGGRSWVSLDWEDNGLRPVAEIYSHHGQSELYDPDHPLAYEINRLKDPGDRENTSAKGPHYLQDAWVMGKRIGVIASSDDHYGQGGKSHQGVAAVYAPQLSRRGIFHALKARHCYGTTGERILLDFSINGAPMGSEITASPGDTLRLCLDVHGTAELRRVEVLRYRRGDHGYRWALDEEPSGWDASYEWTEPFSGPVLYYARITQAPLVQYRQVMAWSSPVWVDPAG